jgi:hypothetical protein
MKPRAELALGRLGIDRRRVYGPPLDKLRESLREHIVAHFLARALPLGTV